MSAVQTIPADDLGRWEDEGGAIVVHEPEPQSAPRAARMTYRERRLARAERLRDWAEKREARADVSYQRARELGQMIPLGQPILVGHHSERGHRAHLAKIDAAMRDSCESTSKAQRMASAADSIDRQAKYAIYSDDPDAIERLEAKLASLEAQRESMKTANAAYRREHAAELRAMSAYQRSQALPFPSWAVTNLTGNIGRTRDRLEQLRRQAKHGPSFRTISARFASTCDGCGASIEKGATIRYARGAGAFHVGCEEGQR